MTKLPNNHTIAVYCQRQHSRYQEAVVIAQDLGAGLLSDLDDITYDYQYILFWQHCMGTQALSVLKNDYNDINKLKTAVSIETGGLNVDYVKGVIAGKKCYRFTYNDALPKAMGLAKLKNQHVSLLDGTAGFTLDSYALLQLNSNLNITLLENSKILFYLVNDGLLRARQDSNIIRQNLANRMKLINNDFINYLKTDSESDYQIIYLDPMFEKDKSSKDTLKVTSKPKQNMQLLQDMCSNPNDASELVSAALEYKIAGQADLTRRIILKRGSKQPKLFEKYINYSVESKQIRYDVYLV